MHSKMGADDLFASFGEGRRGTCSKLPSSKFLAVNYGKARKFVMQILANFGFLECFRKVQRLIDCDDFHLNHSSVCCMEGESTSIVWLPITTMPFPIL